MAIREALGLCCWQFCCEDGGFVWQAQLGITSASVASLHSGSMTQPRTEDMVERSIQLYSILLDERGLSVP